MTLKSDGILYQFDMKYHIEVIIHAYLRGFYFPFNETTIYTCVSGEFGHANQLYIFYFLAMQLWLHFFLSKQLNNDMIGANACKTLLKYIAAAYVNGVEKCDMWIQTSIFGPH
ncbi:hypothetical protein ACJX0J_030507 [Zea mays]